MQKILFGGKKMKVKSLFSKAKSNVVTFANNMPGMVKPVVATGMAAMMGTSNVLADFSPNTAVTTMAGYVCSILMGVGIIYALIAIFNWVSAVKQEDAERQSKSIVNVFIAGLLILIKPISIAIINALGGDSSLIGD